MGRTRMSKLSKVAEAAGAMLRQEAEARASVPAEGDGDQGEVGPHLPVWWAICGDRDVFVRANLWYEARTEAARQLAASPMDIQCSRFDL